MDYKHQAELILCEHNNGVMSCTSDLTFDNIQDMWEFTLEECAFILTNKLLEGKYSPMQFNAIRNELAKLINNIFIPFAK